MTQASRDNTAPRRIDSIDGLRGLFATAVMCGHLSLWSGIELPGLLSGLAHKMLIYAVAGFFVISGLSMAHVYASQKRLLNFNLRRFFMKRFLRLAPLYYGVTLIYFIQDCRELGGCTSIQYMDLGLNLSFLFGIFSPGVTALPIGGWSIGIEWVYYLLFPILIAFCRGNDKGKLLGVMLLLAFVANLYVAWSLLPKLAIMGTQAEWFGFYANPIVYLAYFLSGVYWVKWVEVRKLSLSFVSSGLLATGALFLLVQPYADSQLTVVTGLAGGVLMLSTIVFCCLAFMVSLPKWMHDGASFLGNISYSAYLLHPLVYFGITMTVDIKPLLAAAITLIFTPILSHYVYHYYERPFMSVARSRP